MYIILGATGHIGSVVVKQLVKEGKDVLGITSNEEHLAGIEKTGAKGVVADVRNVEQLTQIFKKGKRLYLLNPPAPPHLDTSVEEQKNVHSILEAVRNTSFEKIVAESTYGAQPGDQLGDLDVLYKMEKEIKKIEPRTTIIRGAYYFSNWDMSLDTAIKEGKVYSLYPADFKIPMVAPADIGLLAAKLLQAPADSHSLTHIEGPGTYSPNDVAAAFGNALEKPVTVAVINPDKWMDYLIGAGFSKPAAQSMSNMTRVTLDKKYELTDDPERGETTLDEYVRQLVAGNKKS